GRRAVPGQGHRCAVGEDLEGPAAPVVGGITPEARVAGPVGGGEGRVAGEHPAVERMAPEAGVRRRPEAGQPQRDQLPLGPPAGAPQTPGRGRVDGHRAGPQGAQECGEILGRLAGERRPGQPAVTVEDDDVEPPPQRHVDPHSDRHRSIVAHSRVISGGMAATAGGRGTATSRFGVSRRESHDASEFYARFRTPEISGDDRLAGAVDIGEPLRCVDARALDLPDGSVALVVTSPPYFAGKEYEAALGEGSIPASYLEYLGMLRDVFAECRRVLEPGGRIAVNVANLGRKPYRSLSADVIRILQDDLGLL